MPFNLSSSPKIAALAKISGVSSNDALAKGPLSLLLIPCLSIDIRLPLFVITSANKEICL